MPETALKNMADDSNKSLKTIKKYWDEAKKAAADQGFKESEDRFWAYVMGIVKKRAGIKESADILSMVNNHSGYRLKKIIENFPDKENIKATWESCKDQARILQKNKSLTNEQTIRYAVNILETVLGYNSLVEGDLVSIEEPKDIKKQRKDLENKIDKIITPDEWKKLKKSGYDVNKISGTDLAMLNTEIDKAKKKQKKGSVSAFDLIGGLLIGAAGGLAAAKAINSFFKWFGGND